MPPKLISMRSSPSARLGSSTRVPGRGWFSFELHSNADMREALWWLNQAYELAKGGGSDKSADVWRGPGG